MKDNLLKVLYLGKITFMRTLVCLVLLIVFTGCKKEIKENHPKIEIYLLKHPVVSNEGILFRETEEYKRLDDKEKEWYKDNRIDTLTGDIIYGGKFSAKEQDLQEIPFINDEEIYGFDSRKDIMIFDSIVPEKIATQIRGSVQFAITIDRRPVLTGYFWTGFSTNRNPSWYSFWDDGFYDTNYINKKGKSMMLEFGVPKFIRQQKVKRPSYFTKRPLYNLKLIEAFRSSNRLIE